MKLFLQGIIWVALMSFSPLVLAQNTTYYTGGSGDQNDNLSSSGAYEDPSNWTNGVPNGAANTGSYGDIFFSGLIEVGNVLTDPNPVITITASSNQSAQGLGFFGLENSGLVGQQPGTINLQVVNGNTLTITGNNLGGLDAIEVTDGVTTNLSGNFVIQNGPVVVGDFIGSGTLNLTGTFNLANSEVDVGASNGSSGTLNQAAGSTVTEGSLFIGTSGGNGTYSIAKGSSLGVDGSVTLGIGTLTQGAGSSVALTSAMPSSLLVGSVSGDNATYNLAGTLSLNSATLSIGDSSGATGTFTQTAGTLTSSGTVYIGNNGSGTYILSGGTATINDQISAALNAGSRALLVQSGGTLNSGGLDLGSGGQATYNLSGGTATLDGLSLGDVAGSSGTLNQSGGSLNIVGANTNIGQDTGTTINGFYNVSGGTANFGGGLTIYAGTVTQTGGAVTVGFNSPLVIAQANSVYNLNGGSLSVGSLTPVIFGAGKLNFGGGTLLAQGGAITDPLSGSVTGASTLDTTGGNITLTGSLNGSGGFNIVGGNTATLNITDVYTGNTTVNGSTLALAVPTSPADTVYSFASAISGNGNLNINFINATDTAKLLRPIDLTGTTTIGPAGTLELFSGTLNDVAGAGSNLILGGDTSVATSGTLNLTGTNSYTGTTTVDPGFTLLASNLASMTVTNNGTLGSNGTTGSTFNIGTGGTGTLNMPEGAQEGTLGIRVAGNTADKFATGTSNLYGAVGVTGYSAIGTTQYTIVTTAPAGLTTGTLNNPDTNDPDRLTATAGSSILLTATLSKSATNDDLYLNVTQLPISQFAQTPNQRAVANSLDQALASPNANDSLFASIDTLSAGELPGALDQLTPRPYLYMRDIAFENSTFLAQSVDARLSNLRSGFAGVDTSGLSMINPGLDSGLGRSLNSLLAYNNQTVAPNGVNYYPQDPNAPLTSPSETPSPQIEPHGPETISDSPDTSVTPTVAPPPSTNFFDLPNVNEFISGDVVLADLNQNSSNNNEPHAHYTAGDATAGISFKMTNNLAAGVLFDYNHTDARTDSQGSHVRVDTYSPGLFATFFERGFYVNGLFTFGYNNYSNTRDLAFGGTSANAQSSPSGQQYVGNLDFGYDFHPFRDPHWIIGPTAGIEYTHLDVDSFSESGAGPADLAVSSQSADSLRARIGGHVVYQIHTGSILFQPNITAQYQHEFLNDPFGLTSQLDVPSTTPFTIQGTNPGRDSALIGVGLTTTLDNSMSLYLNYIAEIGGTDYFVQSIEGGVKATF